MAPGAPALYPAGMEGSGDFPLRTELRAFEAQRAGLLARAPGKYALIHGDQVIGVFDAEMDGIAEGYRRLGRVPFLVKKIEAVDIPVWLPAGVVPAA